MKKKVFVLIAFIVTSLTSWAQIQNPVKWAAAYLATSANEGELVLTATIEKNWHTYSQRATEAGPIPTSFKFEPNKAYTLVGRTAETNAHEEFVKAFDAKIFVFTDKAEFRQKIKRNGNTAFLLNCKVEFMSCNDIMCLPPKTESLTIQIK